MIESPVSKRSYLLPSTLLPEYLGDPVRLFMMVSSIILLGYGARSENESPLAVPFLEPLVGNAFSGLEILILILVALEAIRRLAIGDYSLERSPMSRSVFWVGLVVCLYPFLHMVAVEGRFRIPLETLYMPEFVVMLFVWLFLFRRQELLVMTWLLLFAGLFKIFEGLVILTTRGVVWGLLTGWRDGMLMTLLVLGGLLALIIKPEGDLAYGRIRKFLLMLFPFAVLVFMGSMRRSYMLGVVLLIPVLIVYLRASERKVALPVFVMLFVVAGASLLVVGSDGFTERVSSVSDPTTEGSAAYRLLEVYNVSTMVLERPLTGWPMATLSRNSTGIEFENISAAIPHNVYLYTLFRAGILGLVVWGWMLVTAVKMHHRTIRAAVTPYERFLSIWLMSGSLLIVITGFSTPVIVDRLQIFYPFLLLMASFLPGAWSPRIALAIRGERG